MTTIVTRLVKGSALTWTEMDANFNNLNAAKYESGDNANFNTLLVTSPFRLGGAAATPATDLALAVTGRSYFGSAGNLFAVMVAYNESRRAAGQGMYLGASDAAAPTGVISNAAGAALMTLEHNGGITFPLNYRFSAVRTGSNITSLSAGSPIIFNTEEYDVGAAYNAATGIFTAPVAGTYRFDTGVTWNNISGSSRFNNLGLYVGGLLVRWAPLTQADGVFSCQTISAEVAMTASQTAYIGPSANDTAADNYIYGLLNACWFNGRLVA